jgi:triosephosphate isomerase (TIM)
LRTPLVVGNWKMHGRVGAAVELAVGVESGSAGIEGIEVVLCPPFTALQAVSDRIRHGRLGLGAQNVHPEPEGAFTGEIAAAMLADVGCSYVIVGHSERRRLFHEDDALVARKAAACLAAGMCPIVCVGETLEEREAGRTESVLARQVEGALAPLAARAAQVVLAYEPVWAIGTGRTATARQAQAAHSFLRSRLVPLIGDGRAQELRILYGGSVNPEKVAEIAAEPDVDGGLVGGASLVAGTFVDIVRIVAGD